jgi:acetylglutamate kinase
VLSGQANKQIVAALLAAGVDAVGLSGVDGGLLRCQKKQHPTADLGFVGTITQVRARVIRSLWEQGITAVLSPISLGEDGQIYNVNADEAAGAVALAINARLLDFISNVPGVLLEGQVIPQLTLVQAEKLISEGIVSGGMIPKVQAALTAVASGVPQARIVNLAGLATAGGTVFCG